MKYFNYFSTFGAITHYVKHLNELLEMSHMIEDLDNSLKNRNLSIGITNLIYRNRAIHRL